MALKAVTSKKSYGMKLLLINPTHPSTPHISAVRAWRFAEELATRGHQVILLCAASSPEQLTDPDAIAVHDWQTPFVLACPMEGSGWRLQRNRLPSPIRKVVTAWRLVHHGGDLGGWIVNARRTLQQLRGHFAPDLIWATFGMMEAPMAARRIACDSGCPWILDIKDNWELYVPRSLRRFMVWRTQGWAALTANARFTQAKARKWQQGAATVVYSGVDAAFFSRDLVAAPSPGQFRINLIGSLYSRDRLEIWLNGVKTWAEGLTPAQRVPVTLAYLGGDTRLFTEAVGDLAHFISIEHLGYLPVAAMAQHCRNAAVNAYIAHPGNFHHKLLELLACQRPVLAFPEEDEESWALAQQVAGDLQTPADASAVSQLLQRLHTRWLQGDDEPQAASADYSWPRQAAILEQLMRQIAEHSGGVETSRMKSRRYGL
ncbi:MAG: hypothetical protein EKK69_12620 [Candidatus Competibacteraceae bacterium]|nr:MAG: hypothetical protein EKK69_12620 [Candidatus Competibacteraceae bacterium]